MQANYPKKSLNAHWDSLNLRYPVRNYPEHEISSETIGRVFRGQPEVLRVPKQSDFDVKQYNRNYNITNELTRSQTAIDFDYKAPETYRINKHTSCNENEYIYPPRRRFADRPPRSSAYGTSEMNSAYTTPTVTARLCMDKDQYKHGGSLEHLEPYVEPSFHKEIQPIDTTHEGYEKYLDPYLTTSRLHHRPFTADQLNRLSVSKDIVTYHTLAKDPWVRTTKPIIKDWRVPMKRAKTIYDRERFKEDFREIITHNKLNWVPGTFRTETSDNYMQPESHIHNNEENIRALYQRFLASLMINTQEEDTALLSCYSTEYSHIGAGRPLSAAINQCVEKNKRLERKFRKID